MFFMRHFLSPLLPGIQWPLKSEMSCSSWDIFYHHFFLSYSTLPYHFYLFIYLFVYLFIYLFLATPHGIWDLSSLTRDRLCVPLEAEAWSLNHCTTRKDPLPSFLPVISLSFSNFLQLLLISSNFFSHFPPIFSQNTARFQLLPVSIFIFTFSLSNTSASKNSSLFLFLLQSNHCKSIFPPLPIVL